MTRVRVNWGRPMRRSRGALLAAALTAAGQPPLISTYEETQGFAAERFFVYRTMEAGFTEMAGTSWPSDAESLDAIEVTPLFRDGTMAVYELADGTLTMISVGYGWARVRAAGPTTKGVYGALAAFQATFPPLYLAETPDENVIPITFWTMGSFGPEQRLRRIETASWTEIESNYPEDVRAALALLMDGFEPGRDGQLLLWQGPPGTGKTWALRALASEWRSWAEFSYITDPDAFFVDRPSYMIDVLLHDSYEAIDQEGAIYTEGSDESKWRVLILEDTGELLSANAKEKYGQGLSRLLNVVDGMIGQGLRVLCLVTTNDELGDLNEAIRRPGRCASQIVFPAFPADEASAWLGEPVEEPLTLAEMYARRGAAAEPLQETFEIGDSCPDCGKPLTVGAEGDVASVLCNLCVKVYPTSLHASAWAAVDASALRREIVTVAHDQQESAVGYGETAWNADLKTVYWIHGDWTDCDAARAAFLEIDGVEEVVCEAEGIPEGWWAAEVVYPPVNPPRWVVTPPQKAEAALQDAVALAAKPLA